MESSMARQHRKNLLVLPWAEPGTWVFQNADASNTTDICSVPELHLKRSIPQVFRCIIRIARKIQPNDCLITWEASAALATSIAIRMTSAKNPWVALGVIPKFTHPRLAKMMSSSLKRATIVTCFSQADIPTLESLTGVSASDVTPTVWQPDDNPAWKKTNQWASVGASNRDDRTLARVAENCGITVDRYTRNASVISPSIKWYLNRPANEINAAFHTYRYQLAVLTSTDYASGLSIAVRAGFARQLLIATDTPHMRDLIINGENGLLVRCGDSDHLAQVIRNVMNGDVDVDRLSGMLNKVCHENHTYISLQQHIEKMVARCC